MPVPSSFGKLIQAMRGFIASGGAKGTRALSPYPLCRDLFRNPGGILECEETLDAVLALAREIEAYRGKGSQILQREFDDQLGGLLYHAELETFEAAPEPDLFPVDREPTLPPAAPPFWAEKLSDYFFERVQGKPARSLHTAVLKSNAWSILGELSGIYRRLEPLPLALETAAETRKPEEEREGAIRFLSAYWTDEDPDKATIDLLEGLCQDPPNRSFLVTVLQVRIDLGLSDEMEALLEVEDWDDEEDEGEEE